MPSQSSQTKLPGVGGLTAQLLREGCRLRLWETALVGQASPPANCVAFSTIINRLPSEANENYNLWAFLSLWGCGFITYWKVPEELRHHSTVFLAILPEFNSHERIPSAKELRQHWEARGYIFRDVGSHTSPTGIWGKTIAQSVDCSIIREWLQFCKENHNAICVRPKAHLEQRVPGFRLIDCDTEAIIYSLWTVRYAALSYVWGTAKKTDWIFPKVVMHAIFVTRALGIRYIWVDRYCIDQSNEAQKHDQIAKMNLIYEGAEITIINTAGDNADSGLPGVGNEPRPPQPQASVRGMLLLGTLTSPQKYITKSTWSNRGWTYQEGILSNRRLVFTKEQVYFECRGMWMQETIHIPLVQFHTKTLKWLRTFIDSGLFTGFYKGRSTIPLRRSLQDILQEFNRHLQNYTLRKLSYPTDSLNAFAGILKEYSLYDKGTLSSIFGLPVIRSSYPELIGSLAYSICTWHHESDSNPSLGKRIQELPSWMGVHLNTWRCVRLSTDLTK